MTSMSMTEPRRAIRDKVIALAVRRGVEVSDLKDSDVIPERGVLDSVAVLELIAWFEMTFDLTIDQPDLTIENFGSIDAMTSYVRRAGIGG
jgi:acyl carrier protein